MSVFFIVSSGRSGTAMLHKALSASAGVEMHHEYMVHIVQPLAVRRYHGLIGAEAAKAVLRDTHIAAARYSEAAHWGDSSNKLSWLIPELAELLPDARFVHLVRDGRKVAGSYFRKLGDECYDDRSTAILARHLADPAGAPAPPPEKKYWWPQAKAGDPFAAEFSRFTQFERIAWHWAEINRVIFDALAAIAPERQHFVKLEDLHAGESAVHALWEFLTIPYRAELGAMFCRPHNVNRPEDRLLDGEELRAFSHIAGPMMQRLSYAEAAEYVVKY